MKIVIIDDSDDIRKVLRKIILSIGAEIVGEAANFTDGLELTKNADVQVVILDIKLGNKSGLDILKKVKSKRKTPIVIIFSNYTAKQYKEKAFKEKADYFFNKTDEFFELIEILNHLNDRVK